MSSEMVAGEVAETRWQDLYRIGGIASFVGVALVIFAIVAFFIWPYQPGYTSTAEIFATLQENLWSGLAALDLLFILGTLLSTLPMLALYASLKRVNESYALIALALGLIGIVSLIPARPIAEMVQLSNQYAAATTDAVRSQYLAAGDALLALFNGTAWLVNIVLVSVSSLISCLLMLRSHAFNKATAIVGIASNAAALCFFIPVVGIPLLFVATIGAVAFQFLVGLALNRLAREAALSGGTTA